MYEAGLGVVKDDVAAAHWISLSAEQGNAAAQTVLGLFYDTGKGLPKNTLLRCIGILRLRSKEILMRSIS